MTWLSDTWASIWPNLVASAIAFGTSTAWHLVLVRRTLRHHERVLNQRLTVHEQRVNPTVLEDESDAERD